MVLYHLHQYIMANFQLHLHHTSSHHLNSQLMVTSNLHHPLIIRCHVLLKVKAMLLHKHPTLGPIQTVILTPQEVGINLDKMDNIHTMNIMTHRGIGDLLVLFYMDIMKSMIVITTDTMKIIMDTTSIMDFYMGSFIIISIMNLMMMTDIAQGISWFGNNRSGQDSTPKLQ
ncbi:uncharacterized protein ACMZJ9_010670 [Mantella aurantiaca]